MQSDLSIRIGGDAGQGVDSGGAGLCKAIARSGLHVFAHQDFRSRIRNGHNFYQIRVAGRPVFTQVDRPNVLLALTAEAVQLDGPDLAAGAAVVYDDKLHVDAGELRSRGLQPVPVPLRAIAEHDGSRLMMNTAGIAVVATMTGIDFGCVEEVIRENFLKLGAAVAEANLAVARDARAFVLANVGQIVPRVPVGDGRRRLVINGNHAFALGAIAAGCQFVAMYPMTPATSISEFIAGVAAQLGVVTKQTEDEIAAICMAIGASAAGVRAMTTTSGGGFSLMVEALGLAGITETPLVVVDVQRGGPSTGLPTRTEQSDLLFVTHASQGEFPRVVLAPGTVEACFEAGWRSFNLADRYQCPVIVLSDLTLATELRTVDPADFDFGKVPVDRGALLDHAALDMLQGEYQRYQQTGSGISPRAVPGHPAAVFGSPSDEHDECGHITEDADVRTRMMAKRMRKEEAALAADIRPPARYGAEQPDLTLVCWGSVTGAARDAVDLLNVAGRRAAVLQFTDLWPFPVKEAVRALSVAGLTIGVEQNYTGQLGKLIRMTTGYELNGRVCSFDGRPLAPQEIVDAVNRVLSGERTVVIEAGEAGAIAFEPVTPSRGAVVGEVINV